MEKFSKKFSVKFTRRIFGEEVAQNESRPNEPVGKLAVRPRFSSEIEAWNFG